MTGKQKCAILKQIRRDIAAKNDISITIEECTHKGNCKGTCPRCEAEVRMLEKELEKKRKAGARTVLAGVSAGLLAAGLTACSPVEKVKDLLNLNPQIEELEGDVAYVEPELEGDPIETELEGDPIAPEEGEPLMGEPAYLPDEEEIETGEVEAEPDDPCGDDCEVEETAGVPVAGTEENG